MRGLGSADRSFDDGIRLRLGGSSWTLTSGEYVVGRSVRCHIVIDSASVSRRHAALRVRGSMVTLRDLDSANGVFVNGTRVGSEEVSLSPSDRFLIGDAEFTLEAASRSAAESAADTLPPGPSGADELRPASGTYTTPPRGPSGVLPSVTAPAVTGKKEALELLGSVAERAIAAGYTGRAEDLLRPRLTELLDDARQKRPLDVRTCRLAVTWALRLALQQKRIDWLEHALLLLTHTRRACDGETLALLTRAQEATPAPLELFTRYAGALRGLPATADLVATERYLSTLVADASSR